MSDQKPAYSIDERDDGSCWLHLCEGDKVVGGVECRDFDDALDHGLQWLVKDVGRIINE